MTLKTEVDTETQAPTPKLAVSSLKWLAEKADITEAVNVDDIQVHVMTRYNSKTRLLNSDQVARINNKGHR